AMAAAPLFCEPTSNGFRSFRGERRGRHGTARAAGCLDPRSSGSGLDHSRRDCGRQPSGRPVPCLACALEGSYGGPVGLLGWGRSRSVDRDFVAFYAERGDHLRNTAFLLCGDWHLAEDLTQIAFTKLYRSWHRLDRHDTL